MADIAGNLKFLRERKGLKQSEMLDFAGYGQTTWNNYEKGVSTPKVQDLIKLSKIFDVSIDDIVTKDLTKKAGKVEEQFLEYDVKPISKGRRERTTDIQGIPFYNVHATAGVIELLRNRNDSIPLDHIRIPNLPRCDGAIPITGDSMYPLLKSGDIVLYKEVSDKRNIIWGEMYLVAIVHNGDEFFFVKYLQKGEKESIVRFVSQNNHHQPVEFPIDSIMALALVKASIRINSNF